MKETLASKFQDKIYPFLRDGVILGVNQNRVKKELHTSAVRASIAALGVNPVLGAVPPPIHPSEQSLSRSFRTTLSRLRSGKCFQLNSYQHFINALDFNTCPDCQSAPHTSSHLFNCPSNPTSLSVIDLWLQPVLAAEFIASLTSFNQLPPLNPPLPPPPPEPDP